jgi:nucleoside permease NupC
MKTRNILIVLLLICVSTMFSQSKKEIKKNKIKAMMVVDVENGQTLPIEKQYLIKWSNP